jgi:hypothetical protein
MDSTFNSVFWISTISLILGSIGLSIKYCLKSKCNKINLCFGLIKIDRDIEAEEEIELSVNEPKTPINDNNV